MAQITRLNRHERQWRAVAASGLPFALLIAPEVLAYGDIPLCGFRHLTGLPCPLCGGTRVCAALAQGNFDVAWATNAGLVVLMGLVALQAIVWGAQALTGSGLQRWQVGRTTWLAGLGVLLIGWLLQLAAILT